MQSLKAMMLKLKEQFGKNLVVMPKVQFNSLQFQKQIQKSLNQVSRLTEFKMERFTIDNVKLNRSLASAIKRAEWSAQSLKIKTVVARSPLSRAARQYARAAAGESGGGGAILAGAPRGLAPAALGCGAYRGPMTSGIKDA